MAEGMGKGPFEYLRGRKRCQKHDDTVKISRRASSMDCETLPESKCRAIVEKTDSGAQ